MTLPWAGLAAANSRSSGAPIVAKTIVPSDGRQMTYQRSSARTIAGIRMHQRGGAGPALLEYACRSHGSWVTAWRRKQLPRRQPTAEMRLPQVRGCRCLRRLTVPSPCSPEGMRRWAEF
jgi:hypothetical protein